MIRKLLIVCTLFAVAQFPILPSSAAIGQDDFVAETDHPLATTSLTCGFVIHHAHHFLEGSIHWISGRVDVHCDKNAAKIVVKAQNLRTFPEQWYTETEVGPEQPETCKNMDSCFVIADYKVGAKPSHMWQWDVIGKVNVESYAGGYASDSGFADWSLCWPVAGGAYLSPALDGCP